MKSGKTGMWGKGKGKFQRQTIGETSGGLKGGARTSKVAKGLGGSYKKGSSRKGAVVKTAN